MENFLRYTNRFWQDKNHDHRCQSAPLLQKQKGLGSPLTVDHISRTKKKYKEKQKDWQEKIRKDKKDQTEKNRRRSKGHKKSPRTQSVKER